MLRVWPFLRCWPSPQPSRLWFQLRSTSSIHGVVPEGEGEIRLRVLWLCRGRLSLGLNRRCYWQYLNGCRRRLFVRNYWRRNWRGRGCRIVALMLLFMLRFFPAAFGGRQCFVAAFYLRRMVRHMVALIHGRGSGHGLGTRRAFLLRARTGAAAATATTTATAARCAFRTVGLFTGHRWRLRTFRSDRGVLRRNLS